MSQPTSEEVLFAQKGGNRYQGRYKKPYNKSTRRQKNTLGVEMKVIQSLIVNKSIRKTEKKIIEEAMNTSPELVDTVRQASLASEG